MTELPPPPPSAGRKLVLSTADEAARKRARWYLLLVPFAFPVWWRLRREHPAAAQGLRLELAVCVLNSVLVALLGCCLFSTLAFRGQIIEVLTRWVIASGLVR